jgi:hypothetical protein
MPNDTDNAEATADRLEAALERIAQAANRPVHQSPAGDTEEVAARLDGLINRLRTALASKPG